MAIDAREERRRNLKALAIAGVIVLLCAAFAFRPATIIGVDGDALAHSLGASAIDGPSKCVEVSDDLWECQILQGSSGLTATVTTRAFGCWEAVGTGPTGEEGVPAGASGCINATDFVNPF